jgi:hypothetical protein
MLREVKHQYKSQYSAFRDAREQEAALLAGIDAPGGEVSV